MRQHWYAVQVMAGREQIACDLIERFVDPGLLAEVFTPRYEVQRKVRGAWEASVDVLFPGYLIVVAHSREDADKIRAALRAVPEFTRLLAAGNAYVPLDATERAWICAFTHRKDRTVKMSMGVMEGDRVVVTSGPLMRREGWIRSINRRKSIAYLEIQMFGRTIQTKVGLGIVAKQAGTE